MLMKDKKKKKPWKFHFEMSFLVLVIYSFVSWCWQQKKKQHVEWIPSMSLHIPCTQWKPRSDDQVTECHRHLFSSCINGKKNMRLDEKGKKRVLVAFDGQELPVFNAG